MIFNLSRTCRAVNKIMAPNGYACIPIIYNVYYVYIVFSNSSLIYGLNLCVNLWCTFYYVIMYSERGISAEDKEKRQPLSPPLFLETLTPFSWEIFIPLLKALFPLLLQNIHRKLFRENLKIKIKIFFSKCLSFLHETSTSRLEVRGCAVPAGIEQKLLYLIPHCFMMRY